GAAVYILVVKLSQPDIPVIKAVPNDQSSASAQPTASSGAVLTTITTEVEPLSQTELTARQQRVDSGQDKWLLDPLTAAKQLAQEHGFAETDPFSRQQASSSASLTSVDIQA